MPTQLLVLGIDAASPDLLRRWAAEGKLPAIRRLLDRGISGPVRGIDGFFVGSTWPSFYTGLNPAGHGFYRFAQIKPGTYDFFEPLASPDTMGGTPFWTLASQAGRRVAVLDVPVSRMDPTLNGCQVVEWGSHDMVFGFHASSHEIEHRILSTVGPYPLPSDCDDRRQTAGDFERFVTGLETAAAKKAQITLDVLDADRWDLLVQVFTEAHCAGHQCWHLHDSAHPSHDAAVVRALGDPLERVYSAIDRSIATILERAGDIPVLLFSAHGMSYFRGAQFLLPEILVKLGVTVRGPAFAPPADAMGRRLAKAVWHRMPVPQILRQSVTRSVRRHDRKSQPSGPRPLTQVVDVHQSRCFPVENGLPVGAIRLNLAGREPHGVLHPGADADTFCTDLAQQLMAITDDRTGAPLVAAVHRTSSMYHGIRHDTLPDLLVEWSASVPTGTRALADGRGARVRAMSPRIGVVEGANTYGRTGEHLPTGIFVFSAPGRSTAIERSAVSLMDFHPTICRLMGVSASDGDGVAIPEIAP